MRITFTPEFLDVMAIISVAVVYFFIGFFTGKGWTRRNEN